MSHSGGDMSVSNMYSSNLPLPPPESIPPHPPTRLPASNLISLMVSVDVKHHVFLLRCSSFVAQELRESRGGGRAGLRLALLISHYTVFVDMNQHRT